MFLKLTNLTLWGYGLQSPLKCFKGFNNNIYKTIILPVVLCECEIWSLTLREECRLRVFENRISYIKGGMLAKGV